MKENLLTVLQDISEESKTITVFAHSALGLVYDVIKNIFVEKKENKIDISSIDSTASISIDLKNVEDVEYDYDNDLEIVRIIGGSNLVEIHY